MRAPIRPLAATAVFILACGRGPTRALQGSGGSGPVPSPDGGSPTGGSAAADGGSVTADGGSAVADAGFEEVDAGPESFADCSGIEPPVPGPGVQIRLDNVDLPDERCGAGDVDGNGKIALFCNGAGDLGRIFLADASDGKLSGPFGEAVSAIAGQASGFIGANCLGGDCFLITYGVSDSGQTTFRNQGGVSHGTPQVDNPAGGVVRPHFGIREDATVSVESFDASGNLRWARALPEPAYIYSLVLGADRAGNVLALWNSPLPAGAPPLTPRDTRGQWFDPAGNPGPVFVAFNGAKFATRMFERVGSGLFVSGIASSDGGTSFSGIWLGQLDAFSTTVAAPPAWLSPRIGLLHMAHGGGAYAVLPAAGAASSTCEQTIELLSASGHRCGAATFVAGGGACTTGEILVGYDGTVVQELPDPPCAAEHSCTLGFQAWKGFFR